MKPLAILDVDGVIALEDPEVPVRSHTVSAYGRWRRIIQIPVAAPSILRDLSARFDCVWASAWSHTAHPALQEALQLPEVPWPFLPVQFHKLAGIRAYAAGRPWVWIDDSIDDLGVLDDPWDGLLVRVSSRRGIADVIPSELLARVDSSSRPSRPSPNISAG